MKLDTFAIKRLLAIKDMNYAKLADSMGVARQQISAIMCRGTCSLASANKIAKALGVDIGEIVKEG